MHFRDDEEDKTGASMTHTQCLNNDADSKATLRSSICTIPGSVPGPRSCMPQHHHDGCSTAPDEAYSTHQTLSNSLTAAGCYKEGDAPGCHPGYQQPTGSCTTDLRQSV